MNRKKLVSLSILLLLLIFTTCIVISPVSAAKESTWEKVFGSMEGVVGGFFQRVSDNPATWLKVMILIALFAVMYFGALKIGLPRNIAGVVAMVIALIGTVGIPGDALIYLMKLYGGIATTIMIVGPAVGLGWITWKVTREADNRWINLVFAVIWGLFLGLVMAFSETIQNIDVGAELEALSGTIAVITLISLIIIVILIILFFTEKGREVGGAI
ncbi:hypothetical protein KY317_03930 [Candidatus Woesearchaeota archaeon]|nr:hypothetical protein [Candidatus Woesearchaeota archaeon]